MTAFNLNTPKARFEAYYDAKWVPMHSYFSFHRTRFLHSVEFLARFVRHQSNIADLVQPGDGPGPLAEFFALEKDAELTLITSDLRERFDVADSKCDLVLCTETIEHIKDKDSPKIYDLERFNYSGADNMLSECARILRPEGQLFITTPNSSSFANLHKWLMGELPYMAEHVREYTVDLLNEICHRNGFTLMAMEVLDSWSQVPPDIAILLRELLESFPVKRDISRAENIYAMYSKRSS